MFKKASENLEEIQNLRPLPRGIYTSIFNTLNDWAYKKILVTANLTEFIFFCQTLDFLLVMDNFFLKGIFI